MSMTFLGKVKLWQPFDFSGASPMAQWVKNPPANAGDAGSIPRLGRVLEKETPTHSSILAWEIPCTEEPGGLQSMGLQRIGHY